MNIKEFIDGVSDSISNVHRGDIISGVSINENITRNEKFGGWYGTGVGNIDGKSWKITIRINNHLIDSDMQPGTYDIGVGSISANANGCIAINAKSLNRSGISRRNEVDSDLLEFSKIHGLLGAKKRKMPSRINSILCITSSNSGISGDILNNTGIKPNNVKIYKAGSAETIAKIIGYNNKHDITVLYRGGHQDAAMAMFSGKEVLMAISKSKKPICVALGHDVDRPFVYNLADYEYSTPSSFAKSISIHNTKSKVKKIIGVTVVFSVGFYYLNDFLGGWLLSAILSLF